MLISGDANIYDMSPRAEFLYVRVYKQIDGAGPPAHAAGYVEPMLSVVSIRRRSGGEVNTAIISLSLTGFDGVQYIRPEHYAYIIEPDDMIEIVRLVAAPNYRWLPRVEFIGFVQNPIMKISRGEDSIKFLVTGFEQRLNDEQVAGQLVRTRNHDEEVLTQGSNAPDTYINGTNQNTQATWRPMVFNPGGVPNMSNRKATLTRGNMPGEPIEEIRIFEEEGRMHENCWAEPWTLARAVHTVLYWWNDDYYVMNPEFWELDTLFGDLVIQNIDLQGARDLYSDVLPRLLAGTEFSFTVDPAPIIHEISGRKFCRLIFFAKNQARGYAPLYHETPGHDIATDYGTDLRRLQVTRDTGAAATVVTVAGDFGRHQAAFYYESDALTARVRAYNTGSDFIEAWLSYRVDLKDYFDEEGNFVTDEDKVKQFHARFNRDGKDHAGYTYCLRKFALNEAGNYQTWTKQVYDPDRQEVTTVMCYNKGVKREIYDFEPIFENSDYQVRRRRFERTIERKPNSPRREYFQPKLSVTFDGGDNWQWVDDFRIVPDECAIEITTPNLLNLKKIVEGEECAGENWITAIYAGTLQFKFIASVADDKRCSYRSGPDATGVTRFENEVLVIDPIAFPNTAIVAGDDNKISSGAVELAGSIFGLLPQAIHFRRLLQDGIMAVKPQLSGLVFGYEIGFMVDRIIGREISLAVNPGETTAPRYPVIVGVEWLCTRGEHQTILELDVYHG